MTWPHNATQSTRFDVPAPRHKQFGGATLFLATSLLLSLAPILPRHAFAQITSVTSQPSPPANIDPALWQQMLDIDARARDITHLSCDFQQQKITPLLKKPLISKGHVRVVGPVMRQDTTDPHPSSMLIDAQQLRIYYPADKTLEVFDLDTQLGQLASSPLPRLSILRQYFSFEKIPVAQLDPKAADADFLALRLKPADASLSQYVDEVLVLLDRRRGYITKVQWIDADAEKTVIDFSNVKTDGTFSAADLDLKLPSDVKTVRPLGGGTAAAATQRSSP
jgi:outer membrane lipoprotein-sorting protein